MLNAFRLFFDFLKQALLDSPQEGESIRSRLTMLQRPIIIVGAPRTGTTFLHRALSTHPQTKYLPYFEALDTMAPSTLSSEDIGKYSKRRERASRMEHCS